MSSDLPYRAEYAKSSRANCRGCKGNIEKGTLRLAALVQSSTFDGKITIWYHYMCFFGKQRPKSVGDIEHFQNLKIEDQDKIRKKIADSASSSEPVANGKGKGKKATKRPSTAKSNVKLEFKIEYSPSSRATCRGCYEKIIKGEVRASKKDFESDEGKRYGGLDLWHHLECFVKVRSDLQFYQSGDLLPGFSALQKEDKDNVKKLLPEIKPSVQPAADNVDGEVPPKKMKIDKEIEKNDKKFRQQNKKMFELKKILTDLELKKLCFAELLEYNNQEIPAGYDGCLDSLLDGMTFGALLPCKKCQGQYVFTSKGYKCSGSLSEWVACENINLKPARIPFKLPPEFVEDYPEQFGNYKCKVTDRIIQLYDSSVAKEEPLPSSSFDDEPKVKLDRKLPFKGMDIYIYGLPKDEMNEVKLGVQKLGGSVVSSLHTEVAAVISTEEAIKLGSARMKEIEDLRIQVVTKDVIEKCKNMDDAIDKLAEFSISKWGSDLRKRVEKTREVAKKQLSAFKSKSGKSRFLKSGQESKIKLKVQSGTAVDPDSGLVDTAHVYRSKDKEAYTVTLGLTDVQKGLNSYYKLQILESNSGKTYWLFRGWGRIGTTIGGTKVDSFNSLKKAMKEFKFHYEDKTGNEWENHKYFEKVAGKMYPMKVDYGDSEAKEVQLQALDATESKLKKPVQDLITMLFDVNLMKKTMIEYEIDLDKMPLGKISKSQMFQAYSVLTELQQFIEECDGDIKPNQRALLIEATNRFYTLVPHDFGLENPPLLQEIEQIKNKIEMLDSLLEIEFAYEIMQTNQEGGEHSLDSHYAKLNAEIDVIEREAKEFDIIQQYVKNTHAKTHSNYELEIVELFEVNRKEEEKRFKPFKKLPNRKLLWHGSRLTNFAGIISQGLRIAPPEAPTTGYMFGKGIYFADMVSKSANYCMTSPTNNTGLLMLCEVALGNMYERTSAEFIEKLPKGHHSCKGIGGTHPDPKASIKLEDGVEVPVGKATKADISHTDLLYNEYIVYDIAQVKAKYLVKMNFKYKY